MDSFRPAVAVNEPECKCGRDLALATRDRLLAVLFYAR